VRVTAVATPLVAVRDLHKDYQSLRPLRLRELTLHAGDIVSLSGLDEMAAEVLVGLLTGATLPDAGEVRLFDRATSAIADTDQWLALLDGVGLVTARAVLVDRYSVRQNLALPFTLAVDPLGAAWRARVDSLAREVGVPEAQWDVPVGQTDPDAQTRVRLGRALALGPRVLIAEHPTAQLPRDRVRALGADVGRIARARRLAVLALTADEPFAQALDAVRLVHQPVTGECRPAGFWRKILG
jgi:ABC-type lipoprotein export system ATPase subunit